MQSITKLSLEEAVVGSTTLRCRRVHESRDEYARHPRRGSREDLQASSPGPIPARDLRRPSHEGSTRSSIVARATNLFASSSCVDPKPLELSLAPTSIGPNDHRSAIGESEGFVQAEDREIAERPHRTTIPACEEGHRCVLDEQKVVSITPLPPPVCGLRDAEVVDQVEGSDIRAQQLLKTAFIGLQILIHLVEAAMDPGSLEGLDLGSMMVGGREHRVALAEAECSHSLPEAVARARIQAEARFL